MQILGRTFPYVDDVTWSVDAVLRSRKRTIAMIRSAPAIRRCRDAPSTRPHDIACSGCYSIAPRVVIQVGSDGS